ncbi:MAG: glycosyltransferase family 39 protein [Bacteroidales bacterium]|jgi:hypothetical protein|nr:glycosyltransferase family 39 protein [Bacteroidales bacterium]
MDKTIIPNRIILLLILAVAALLRFYDYGSVPFTHDEYSAVFRTNYDSFAQMIRLGVIDGDTHPPLIQIFLYFWIKFFGSCEWIVKLPFTLCGLGAVVFVYLIAAKWFNESVSLISAAFVASMEYSVMYSQIARPYICGMFFSLAMVYFWTKLIQEPERKNTIARIFYVIFAVLCAYNHHFSLLFALITGISGLFLLKGKALTHYILTNLAIPILYLPNLPIILSQLKKGGLSWLAKPHNDWIVDYMAYLFHFSFISGGLAIALALFGWLKPQKESRKYILISLIWFLLPFVIGFLYSRFVDAVLQYSILIFSFPFLLFFLWGQIRNQRWWVNLILVIIIIASNTLTLVYGRQYFKLSYNSSFERLLLDNETAKGKYANIVSLVDFHPQYSHFAMTKFHLQKDFVTFDSLNDKQKLISFLQQQQQTSPYLYVGAFSSVLPETFAIIKDYYPYLLEQNNYYTAQSAVFSTIIPNDKKTLKFDTTIYSNSTLCFMDSITEYSPSIILPLWDITSHKKNFIDISVDVLCNESSSNNALVAELTTKHKSIFYTAAQVPQTSPSNFKRIYLSLKLPDMYLHYKYIELKIYIRNGAKKNLQYKNIIVKRREGNPVIYALLEDIPL